MLPTSLICICISHRGQLHKFIKKVSAGMREILFWSRWFPEFAKAINYVSSAVKSICQLHLQLSVFMAFCCIVFLSSFLTLPELCNQMLSSQNEILDCVTHKKFSHDVRKIVWLEKPPSGKQASVRDLWFSTYKLRNFQHVRINSSLFSTLSTFFRYCILPCCLFFGFLCLFLFFFLLIFSFTLCKFSQRALIISMRQQNMLAPRRGELRRGFPLAPVAAVERGARGGTGVHCTAMLVSTTNALTAFSIYDPELFASLKWILHSHWDSYWNYSQLDFYPLQLFFTHANWHCDNEEVTYISYASACEKYLYLFLYAKDTWETHGGHLKLSFLLVIFHNLCQKLLWSHLLC